MLQYLLNFNNPNRTPPNALYCSWLYFFLPFIILDLMNILDLSWLTIFNYLFFFIKLHKWYEEYSHLPLRNFELSNSHGFDRMFSQSKFNDTNHA